MRTVMTVMILAALLLGGFLLPVSAAMEPSHSNGAAVDAPAPETDPAWVLLAALPDGRVLKVVHTEGRAGPMIVITVRGPGGEAVVVMPW